MGLLQWLHPCLALKLVPCHLVTLQASRLMVRHAAAALDSGSRGATLECAMAKARVGGGELNK